ncbi:MAG: cadherin domain-containing protein [Verrucomicrobiaceae bacterium]|nr:cadherin domain-containing protein [Verrucomicrobiaceae bacterium]
MKLNLLVTLCMVPAMWASAAPVAESSTAFPLAELGQRATEQDGGKVVGISLVPGGAELRTGFQKLKGRVTADGLRVTSTEAAGGSVTLKATAVGREGSTAQALEPTGSVVPSGALVSYMRDGLVEEYSVSADGVRQDFVLLRRPAGNGALKVDLGVLGAGATEAARGVKLTLEGSGRELLYHKLKVTDSRGQIVPAQMLVSGAHRLTVKVEDEHAVYPVRIDPTLGDWEWLSMSSIAGVNDTVNAMAVDAAGNLYVGGRFTLAGSESTSKVAKWDGTSWKGLDESNFIGGTVSALAVSHDTLYIGGNLPDEGHLLSLSLAEFETGGVGSMFVGGAVSALVWSNDKLYVGGSFTRVLEDSIVARRVAVYEPATGTWEALGTGTGAFNGTDNTVRALAVSGGTVYAGGDFMMAGNVSCNRVAKWDGSAWSSLGSGTSGRVRALALHGTDLYVGGEFTLAGGLNTAGVAKWDGTVWSGMGSGISFGDVFSLAVTPGGLLYAGGPFYLNDGGVGVAQWNGSSWSSVGNAAEFGNVLTIMGGDLYVGGAFPDIGGVSASRVAKWNGTAWSALGSGKDGNVRALAVSGSTVYVGGEFKGADGVLSSGILKWENGIWSGLGGGVTGNLARVNALALDGSGNLYVAGGFTHTGGVPADNIAKWDGTGWSALGTGLDNTAYALALSGSDLYVGGAFGTAGGVTAFSIAKWNGTTWSALGGGLPSVNALAVSGSTVYAGGDFGSAGDEGEIDNVAQWDGSKWSALGTGLNGKVYALALMGGNLYAGGEFDFAGDEYVTNVAKWNGRVWTAASDPNDPLHGTVYALAAKNGKLWAGGDFSDGIRLLLGEDVEWARAIGSVNVDDGVLALAVDADHDLFVGGYFQVVGNIPTVSPSIAKLNVAEETNFAPTDITLSNASLAENNTAAANVGTLSAVDADVADSHTFTLEGGADDAAFTIVGNNLRLNDPADFEVKNSYSLRIRATDNGNGSLTYEKDFSVTITDVQLTQSITFDALTNKMTNAAPFALSATATSGLPVSFSVQSGPASISGDTVTLAGTTGTVTIRASQAGGVNDYEAATPVDRSFLVIMPNATPVAEDDFVTFGGATTTISPLLNDTDPDNDTLTIIDVGDPSTGSVTFTGSSIIYTKNSTTFDDQDGFTYTVSDGKGGEDTAVVIVASYNGLAGTYTGLLDDGTGTADGIFRATVTVNGNLTGRAVMNGRVFGLSGRLDNSGKDSLVSAGATFDVQTIPARSDIGEPRQHLAVIAVETGVTYTGNAIAHLYSSRSPVSAAGVGYYHTAQIAQTGQTGLPASPGWMRMLVAKSGAVTVSGRGPDTLPVSCATAIVEGGEVMVYANGLQTNPATEYAGILDITLGGGVTGVMKFNKLPQIAIKGALHATGFSGNYDLVGGKYTKAAVGTRALTTNGAGEVEATMTGAGHASPTTKTLTLSVANVFTPLPSLPLSQLKITAAGQLTGTVKSITNTNMAITGLIVPGLSGTADVQAIGCYLYAKDAYEGGEIRVIAAP